VFLLQETTVKQLQSPLPLPTTLPLLSASIAATKTVIANPVLHLSNHIHDILHTITHMETPPHPAAADDRVRPLIVHSACLSLCLSLFLSLTVDLPRALNLPQSWSLSLCFSCLFEMDIFPYNVFLLAVHP